MPRAIHLLFLSFCLLISGCSTTIDYSQSYPSVHLASGKTVEIVVVEQRPYVLDGRKDRSFVGIGHGSDFIPYDVETRSGEPLAADLEQALIGGLQRQGHVARRAASTRAASGEDAVLLKIGVREWKSRQATGTVFAYALVIDVLDADGQVLASVPVSGSSGVSEHAAVGRAALDHVLGQERVALALTGKGAWVSRGTATDLAMRRNPASSEITRLIYSDRLF